MAIALVLGVPAAYGMGRYKSKRWKCFPSYIPDLTDASSVSDIDTDVSDLQQTGIPWKSSDSSDCDCSQFDTFCNRNTETLFQKYSGITG